MIGFRVSRREALRLSAGLGLAAAASPALASAFMGPAPSAATIAATAKAALARADRRITQRDIVGVADFGRPSSEARLHLVEIASGRITSLLVAHGRGSDPGHTGWLRRFSNSPGSDCTSEGAYLASADYIGEHGPSMRLIGLDPSNDNAETRAIVVHPAAYVGPEVIRAQGVLGRSNGCFAVSQADLPSVLTQLRPGSLLIAAKL